MISAFADSQSIREHLDSAVVTFLGKKPELATAEDYCRAAGFALRDQVVQLGWSTESRYRAAGAKEVAYLSLEFLVGRCLRSNLSALGLLEPLREALKGRGVDLSDVLECEPDPALGNGGLGRLAACFLESLASLSLPATGYGILYDYGLFQQEMRHGWQFERPDEWDWHRYPWLVGRFDEMVWIPMYGHVEHSLDREGRYNPMWMDWQLVAGVPYDLPVIGADGQTVQFLRLYSARSSNDFDMQIFNVGDYLRAVQQKIESETISRVLYPADEVPQGRELRLLQEYFLVACAVRDIMSRYLRDNETLDKLPERVALQMNDTHPTLAVAELMRTLIDEHGVEWDQAWEWTRAICGYTNHTLMAEALETWPVELLEKVLPRHLQIIYEINDRFLQQVRERWPGDEERVQRMSLIGESGGKRVRMAHLAIVGSHAVNGVSALHSRLVAESLVPDFAALWPERFQNKTNGVTHRRWLKEINPPLAALLTETIGEAWVREPQQLERLAPLANDPALGERFLACKLAAKTRLADYVRTSLSLRLDPASLFDIQIKRIHQYKRQLLNILSVIYEYLRISEDGWTPEVARTCLFAGKAAPSYRMAKLIMRLIYGVSQTIQADPRARQFLTVAFLPDYRVSLAERMIPAADISEQISTAGTEASGTGNMKLSLNGALTIGTYDGANIEIRERVGAENFYLFGLTTEEVRELRTRGAYDPWKHYYESQPARRVIDAIRGNRFSAQDPGLFEPILNELLSRNDPYVHLADLDSHLDARRRSAADFVQPEVWARKALCNVAGMGWFSSDRTILEYARDIWDLRAVPPPRGK
jgi:starch phosphorylase